MPHHFVDLSQVGRLVALDGHHRAHFISTRALFGYLQILLVLTIGLYYINLKSPQILGTVSFGSAEVISITNQKRVENNLPPLVVNELLATAARAKAADMFVNDYWAHYSPNGTTPWSFITGAGYQYVQAGENLARDFTSAGTAVDAWMKSASHRSNLLDANFAEIGVAVVSGKLEGREGILIVQMFGTSVASPVLAQNLQGEPQPIRNIQGQFEGEQSSEQATVLGSNKYTVARTVSLGLIGFIFALFGLEVLVSLRRADMRVKPSIFAHLTILGFVLAAVWYSTAGAVI